MDPLVSVIVPIYNVAPLLRQCLDSLKGQTLKQIEVIMVEDGSTDESGEIAEEYVSDEWPMFRLIKHENNRGLSAARNTGIDESRADWIMFVDSDDWVDEKFCEIPYRTAVENHADMVIFKANETTETGIIKLNSGKPFPPAFIDHETAVDVGGSTAWNKFYRKCLFDDVRYPEKQVYEDMLTTDKLIYKAKGIVQVSDNLYNYRHRKGSISSRIVNDAVWLKTAKQQAELLIRLGYPEEKAKEQLCSIALKCYGRAKGIKNELSSEAAEILQEFDWIPRSFSNKEKAELYTWKFNKKIYRALYKLLMRAK